MGRNSEFKKPQSERVYKRKYIYAAPEPPPPLYIYVGSTPYILASEAAKRMERIIEIESQK